MSQLADRPNRRPIRGTPNPIAPTVCVVDPQSADYAAWQLAAAEGRIRLHALVTGADALRLARNQNIDLWVIHVDLAGHSGIELCDMLKAQSPEAVVYLVTDHYSPEQERAAWAARATLFGCKGDHSGWLDGWLQTARLGSRLTSRSKSEM